MEEEQHESLAEEEQQANYTSLLSRNDLEPGPLLEEELLDLDNESNPKTPSLDHLETLAKYLYLIQDIKITLNSFVWFSI